MHRLLDPYRMPALCCGILYVRNGVRYGGLRICEGKQPTVNLYPPLTELKAAKWRRYFRKRSAAPVGPQEANATDGGPRKGDVLVVTRSIDCEVHPDLLNAGDDRRKRGGVQIAARYLG